MNTGQMLITLAALTLVSITILNHNRSSITTKESITYSKEFIVATSIGQSLLDEISNKSFDENIINGNTILSAGNFSTLLKSETGEAYPDFDDVDDYNLYSRAEDIPQMGSFNLTVSVNYVTDTFQKTLSNTYNKNVTIKITNDALVNPYNSLPDTVVVSSIFSQWVML
ncbi:MAG: hypothetical protein H6613_15370 [Ignavibacteriales bacterium]|nr:hypothetical protein [Ignavibacteriota bacterium]MCB9249823.1 hypothetical protein [Ignavibacteriales bacterium]